MNRRGGKREGAGRKKSPALAKITGEIASWQMAARFVAPNGDVNSDQCQLFNIFRAVFNIYTGKKCPEYLLISFVE